MTGDGNPDAAQANVTFCVSVTVKEEEGFAMKCSISGKEMLLANRLF